MRIIWQFSDKTEFDFHLYENDFTTRWFELFEQTNNNVPYDHVYELTTQGTNEGMSWKHMYDIINKINLHVPNTIPDTYLKNEYSLDDLYNIHLIYEVIAKDDTWAENADDIETAKKDRGLLNDVIHILEAKSKKEKSFPRCRFRFVDPATGQPNIAKPAFEDKDYDLFTPFKKPYTMYLNYNAVGQEWEKQFKANKDPSSAVILKNYSPSFNFTFVTVPYEKQVSRIAEMKSWMRNGGFDPDNKYNSFGQIPLGTLHKDRNESDYFFTLNTSTLDKVWCEK